MQRGSAAHAKSTPTHLFRGILPPTITNGLDFIPNPGFVKSSAVFLAEKPLSEHRNGAKGRRNWTYISNLLRAKL
jgi:hypothetical protein